MKTNAITPKDAIRIITNTANTYDKQLNGKNYIFIYKNRATNQIEYFESVFLNRNFQHLTGLEFLDQNGNLLHNPVYFYQKCISNTLSENEIRFKDDGTTELKLQALPLIVNFLKASKMTAIYHSLRPKLSVDRLSGTTNFCLGFTKTNNKYYVPSSCLLEDIRDLAEVTYQILAILSKPASKLTPVYKDIRYVAKGVLLNHLILSDELSSLISLENYQERP